ncbi:MAG: hypothetical protein ACQESR_17615 [Planctomycetota bacterium]
MESCPTQAVRPLVGLAAGKIIRDRYKKASMGCPAPNRTTGIKEWRENGPGT